MGNKLVRQLPTPDLLLEKQPDLQDIKLAPGKVDQVSIKNGAARLSEVETLSDTATCKAETCETFLSVQKQEQLEFMRDEIRRKQEALAQKRDDIRRKLSELMKQGARRAEFSDSTEQRSLKRQQMEVPSCGEVAVSRGVQSKQGDCRMMAKVMSKVPTATSAAAHAAGQLAIMALEQGPQIKRYKLDNRTTIFRILPPFSPIVSDIAIVKEHFARFGEVASVEMEDAEGIKQESGCQNSTDKTSFVRVSFATRRGAERAFVQGRWLHGHALQFDWAPCTQPVTHEALKSGDASSH